MGLLQQRNRPYDDSTRHLLLRAASSHDRGRTIAHLHVPLPGVPAPHRRRHQQPGAVPPRPDHFEGKATTWTRTAESGNKLTFHFCPICGSTVYWENEGFPGIVAIAIGNSPTRISRRQPSRCGRSRVTPGSLCRRTFRRSERRSRADRLTASKGRLGSRAPGFPSLPPVADMERTSRHVPNGPTAEVAERYSMTSSARPSSVVGTLRPRDLAVLRLMTSSNLFACRTGRSAGFSPLMMRSTYSAARRYASAVSMP